LVKRLSDGDEKDAMKTQLFRTIEAMIKHTDNWQNAQGHITEGQGGNIAEGGTDRQFKSEGTTHCDLAY